MRITQPARIVSSSISLFIQYSLVISITALPFSARAVRGQRQDAAADESGATAVEQEKRLNESGPFGKKTGVPGAKSLVEEVMGFARPKTPNDALRFFSGRSSAEAAELEQEPLRPTLTPPTPGIGSGGTGPDGSFNVETPERLQGPPAGVRDPMEVLNEARTSPRIPDPIPSTESYCWPGDPECRKKSPAKPTAPVAKPTPPPRPQGASNSRRRPSLLVAHNDRYIEKLLSSAMPYLAHLWSSDASPYSLLTADSGASMSRMGPFASISSGSNTESLQAQTRGTTRARAAHR